MRLQRAPREREGGGEEGRGEVSWKGPNGEAPWRVRGSHRFKKMFYWEKFQARTVDSSIMQVYLCPSFNGLQGSPWILLILSPWFTWSPVLFISREVVVKPIG